MKRIIRLTESDLHKIIRKGVQDTLRENRINRLIGESIRRVLRESEEEDKEEEEFVRNKEQELRQNVRDKKAELIELRDSGKREEARGAKMELDKCKEALIAFLKTYKGGVPENDPDLPPPPKSTMGVGHRWRKKPKYGDKEFEKLSHKFKTSPLNPLNQWKYDVDIH